MTLDKQATADLIAYLRTHLHLLTPRSAHLAEFELNYCLDYLDHEDSHELILHVVRAIWDSLIRNGA